MHRFFIESAVDVGTPISLPPDEAAHALRVLRLAPGDFVQLVSGDGRIFDAKLQDGGQALPTREAPSNEAPVRVSLYVGLPKADKLEFVIQKATELGASRVVPVRMARSVVKVSQEDAVRKNERFVKIAREAAKQCGRGCVPEIPPALSWADAISDMRTRELLLVPWEEARGVRLCDVCRDHPKATDIGLLIGPEGGIDPSEIASAPGLPVTLGPRILRAETAAVAALTAVMCLWGDL